LPYKSSGMKGISSKKRRKKWKKKHRRSQGKSSRRSHRRAKKRVVNPERGKEGGVKRTNRMARGEKEFYGKRKCDSQSPKGRSSPLKRISYQMEKQHPKKGPRRGETEYECLLIAVEKTLQHNYLGKEAPRQEKKKTHTGGKKMTPKTLTGRKTTGIFEGL